MPFSTPSFVVVKINYLTNKICPSSQLIIRLVLRCVIILYEGNKNSVMNIPFKFILESVISTTYKLNDMVAK
jgi:hypothetical protein